MGKQNIDVKVTTTGSPATVYALLIDGATWPTWSPIDSFELVSPGPDGRESVGALRIFRTGRTTSREEIVAAEPGRRFSYVLLSGLPLTDYRADVDLTHRQGRLETRAQGGTSAAEQGGTEIHWHTSFDPKIPGTGWIYRLVLGRFIRQVATGLAKHAATTATRDPQ